MLDVVHTEIALPVRLGQVGENVSFYIHIGGRLVQACKVGSYFTWASERLLYVCVELLDDLNHTILPFPDDQQVYLTPIEVDIRWKGESLWLCEN